MTGLTKRVIINCTESGTFTEKTGKVRFVEFDILRKGAVIVAMNQQPHSPRRSSDDDASSKRLLWGFVFALLTFLIVVIAVTTINLFSNGQEIPEDSGGYSNPTSEQQPDDPDMPSDQPSTPGAEQTPSAGDRPTEPSVPMQPTEPEKSYLMYEVSGVTQAIPDYDMIALTGVNAPNTVVVDPASGTILAAREADKLIYPASMTKVMTLLIACEHLTENDYDKTVTLSADIVAEMQRQGASGFGFAGGDVVTVRDLLYAIALESDGAASLQLANYVAGSHEAFVRLMNEKCAALGLKQTAFVNVTGLHDAGHYTTCREMASIMAAALDNATVAMLLGEDSYVTRITHRGAEGVRVTFYSTYYMDVMSPDFNGVGAFYALPNGARVVAAKTGTTPEAGHCLVSCIRTALGKQYIIVSAGAKNASAYCEDLLYIHQTYAK